MLLLKGCIQNNGNWAFKRGDFVDLLSKLEGDETIPEEMAELEA